MKNRDSTHLKHSMAKCKIFVQFLLEEFEVTKKLHGFSYSKNIANVESFC